MLARSCLQKSAAAVTNRIAALAVGDEDDDDASASQATQDTPPEHACAYCGIRNTSTVVKCLTTGR